MLKIDTNFAGGNVHVISQNDKQVELDTDMRDTFGYWFYWYFRAKSMLPRRYKFRFVNTPAISHAGPAVSYDEGKNWQWLGFNNVNFNDESFEFDFTKKISKVRFCVAIPYLEHNWKVFAAKHSADKLFHQSFLNTPSKGNRQVEFARIGTGKGKKVFICARHHCCEMTANYVMEGLIDYALSHKSFHKNITLMVVPFVDKDGVECGDQGKNRKPRDYGRDYGDVPIYPETYDIMKIINKTRPQVILDLHCPYLRGNESENVYFVEKPGNDLKHKLNLFCNQLEKHSTIELQYFKANNLRFGDGWNSAANYKLGMSLSFWASSLEWKPLAATMETPYAIANQKVIIPETSRKLGKAIAKSIEAYFNI